MTKGACTGGLSAAATVVSLGCNSPTDCVYDKITPEFIIEYQLADRYPMAELEKRFKTILLEK